MKTIISKSKIIAIVFALSFSLASAESFAGSSSDTPAELKYLGKVNNQRVFELKLNNSEEDKFIITLLDLSGNIMYTGEATGTNISRTFRLNTDEIGSPDLKFEVRSKKSNTKTVYKVSTTSHVVEDVAIDKL
jgi:hypothetical protein